MLDSTSPLAGTGATIVHRPEQDWGKLLGGLAGVSPAFDRMARYATCGQVRYYQE